MSFTSWAGTLLYRGVEFLSMNVSASHKVTMSLDYRRRWSDFLPKEAAKQNSIWVHGASVGELEDLAAFFSNSKLLERAGYTHSQLILTSSSPSAEEFLIKQKEKLKVLYAGPLPPDVLPRVEEFFEKLRPEILVLSQSDVWPVLMSVAEKKLKRGVVWLPHKSSSASWSRQHLLAPIVKVVGLRQSENSNPLPEKKSIFIGSPRIDRIVERIDASTKDHPLKKQMANVQGKIKILIGSAWTEDALIFREALELLRLEDQNKFEIFAIPHDPKNSAELSSISAYLGKNVVATEGILLESYRDFDMAFVGGGFRTGLHNVTEPLAWGIPTACGADLRKQPEASYFVEQGALKAVRDAEDLRKIFLNLLNVSAEGTEDVSNWKQSASQAKEHLRSQRGASVRLADLISKEL
jgi:3-deoxy-D-manno-octulosonic-acid transferase